MLTSIWSSGYRSNNWCEILLFLSIFQETNVTRRNAVKTLINVKKARMKMKVLIERPYNNFLCKRRSQSRSQTQNRNKQTTR